ncbi:helix-turn-helix transcriptional regulator [Paenibacillus glycanilyticus]|uniref:AraC family transcriptional regulator n=1 Tax=Paenibacillus glycanilyticus TaxID=126569 RepID=A0ABQ6G9Q8_9BACL|nr:AraC family transcriptional regulator [Paenibacillus glycanilyticus]GLX66980.1 AraC family transcriptional regulator [Paenibacillus glycanilyticus]
MKQQTLTVSGYREAISSYTYKDEGMEGHAWALDLREGMTLCISDLTFSETMRLEGEPSDKDWFELSYCLMGGISNEVFGYYEKADERDNHSFLLLSRQAEGRSEVIRGKRSVKVELLLDPNIWASRIYHFWHCSTDKELFRMLDDKPFHVKEAATPPLVNTIVRQIAMCPFDKGIDRYFYLEGKAMELLSLASGQWSGENKQTAFSNRASQLIGRSKTKSAIREASELLVNRLENPPSLAELAKLVSVSDWTLKEGFREMFGTTVFGYLRQARMDAGRRYLEQGMNVNEASNAVGYSNPSHFAAEFRRRFGINPSLLK